MLQVMPSLGTSPVLIIEDPYLGYIVLDGRPFSVRERSPYKNSLDLSTLKDHRVFNEFVEQVSAALDTVQV